MICKNCGNQVPDNAPICIHCNLPVNIPISPINSATQQKSQIPDAYKPLSPWAYFWLSVLFSIPVVGFVFLLVYSFNGSNINRRNYARSYWCGLLVVAIVVVVWLIIAFALFGGIDSAMNELL